MRNVVFVAPYFLDATERFVAAVAKVPDCRLGLISCDPVSKLNSAIRGHLDAHFAVESIETQHLQRGVEAIAGQFGSVDRLLGMLEQIQVPLGEIRDQLGIPGMGQAAANNFRDKARMKEVLRSGGLPCAKHVLINSIDDGLAFANYTGFPLVVKPPDGAGAKATYRCENVESLATCLHHLQPSSSHPVLIEEFIVGKEHSLDSICLNGQLVWHSISHYYPGPLEVVREPWIQWCVMIPREVEEPRYEAIQQIAQPALQALGMQTGLSHMEWFQREDGSVAISEVGARPPGAQITTLISYAHDFDLYRAWAELMIHEQFEKRARPYAAGAAYLRGMGPGQVKHVSGLDRIARELGDLVVEAKVPEPGQQPSGSYEGEGYILVRHPQTQVVADALQKIISTVQVEMS